MKATMCFQNGRQVVGLEHRMTRQRILSSVLAWLALSSFVAAADRVKKFQGTIAGTIAETSALEVKLTHGTLTDTVPVNEIQWIEYQGEPPALTAARLAAQAGRYGEALEGLGSIRPAEVKRPEIQQDLDFYKALCSARIALATGAGIVEAGTLMNAFVQANPKSYHYLVACEALGDLYVAVRQYDKARELYGRVGQAPWPEYRMRAGVAIGGALLAQGKPAEAMQSFEAVLAMTGSGQQADEQRLAATLGKARCLAENKQFDAATKTIQEEIIAKANPEDAALLAKAYNTLGAIDRKAGKAKEAILAYLHVDLLYSAAAREHIEALQNLVALWNEVQKPERAAQAAQVLKERYKLAAP
jgi:tetratricopeptide (TPR) repeat protein